MKKNYSKVEKQSWVKGFLFGLKKSKMKTKNIKKQSGLKRKDYKKTNSLQNGPVLSKKSLLDEIKYSRSHNDGVLYRNGKYYDTNFVDKPVEITKKQIKELRSEYDFYNTKTDLEVANDYVMHMRRKYGVYDRKTGKFLHMAGEKK